MAVPSSLDTVVVIGNGLTGHGTARIFAAAGREVVLIGRREESLAAARLVLEAVPADRAGQDEVDAALDRICAPPAVIASGSGQPASDLVSNVRHRGRVIAAHFWYPPQLIPLVEVCSGPETGRARQTARNARRGRRD